MSAKDLYQEALTNPSKFNKYCNISQQEFDALLSHFKLKCPKKLTYAEKLFAILYVNKNELTNCSEIGRFLTYSSPSNGGKKFIQEANDALKIAKQERKHALNPTRQTQPQEDLIKFDTEYLKTAAQETYSYVISLTSRSSKEQYYNLNADKLGVMKWKNYLYLRKCVLDYRSGTTNELVGLINFLEHSGPNKTWLAKRLLDPSQAHEGEYWGTGNHEWLERHLIIEVLKRSAGMVRGVEAESSGHDWLYIQAILRSPIKYILFKNEDNTIESGHIASLKEDLDKNTFYTDYQCPAFHKLLATAFYESNTIEGFLKRIRNIFKSRVVSGKKKIAASENTKYLVDGSSTSNLTSLSLFRHKQLFPNGYNVFKDLINTEINHVTNNGRCEQERISEITSDTTENTTIYSDTDSDITSSSYDENSSYYYDSQDSDSASDNTSVSSYYSSSSSDESSSDYYDSQDSDSASDDTSVSSYYSSRVSW